MEKTSEEWYHLVQELSPKYRILDPDGWDRKNYDFSFKEELITFEAFKIKCLFSTAMGFLNEISPSNLKDDGTGKLIIE